MNTHHSDRLDKLFELPVDPTWLLVEYDYEPALEHEVESRFTVANGYLGVRGSLEQPTQASRPRTYVAGFFYPSNVLTSIPSLVSAPDWTGLRLSIDGEALSVEDADGAEHSRSLDFERGMVLASLTRTMRSGVTVILRALRFASFSKRGLVAQIAAIDVLQPARLELAAGLGPPAEGTQPFHREPGLALFSVRSRRELLAVSTHSSLRVRGRVVSGSGEDPGPLLWTWDARPGDRAIFTRVAVVSKADPRTAPAARAGRISSNHPATIQRLYRQHVAGWRRRWSESDVVVTGDEESQRALRFAIYHLISAGNPDDDHISIGARALTGDAYKGHVFWDTEAFLLPFYTFTWPAAARAMLMYRYHTLPAARNKAKGLGYRGALYAWESADTGDETTPLYVLGPERQVISIRSGVQEHHISADVAYAVWQYWQATGDNEFLLDVGAEVLLETSRFWASRVQLGADDHYRIPGVIGPDEYHEDVDDNAYTNVMAAFNMECGLKVAEVLKHRWPDRWTALEQKLGLNEEEMAFWRDVEERIFTGFDPDTGLFEQFAGFFSLEDVDLRAYADRTASMDIVLGAERTRHSQVIKQADVVMLLTLLGSRYERKIHEVNFSYYEPRTGHGSSLSPSAHAIVAARLGKVELAKKLFSETAAIDLDDTMGNAAGGVHIGALGGLWQAAVFGFAGLQADAPGLKLDPKLPPGWNSLDFPIQWRRRLVRVHIEADPATLSVTLERGRPLVVQVGGLCRRIDRERTWQWKRSPEGEWKAATNDL